jgi:hypothetical protein
MKHLIYILLSIVLFTACQQDELVPTDRKAVLELTLSRVGRPQIADTRAVDDDLAVSIYKEDGSLFLQYPAGAVPKKIVLEPGTFKVVAYTENQETWQAANEGRGEACYYAEASVEMEFDNIKYLTLNVPMSNYAVGLQLPDLWDTLFRSYTFTLKSGTRTTTILAGERAYFAVADGGFSYRLAATNMDNRTSYHSAIDYKDVSAGKLYTLRYSYDSDATSGGVDIIITDDMGTDDTNIDL